MTHQSPQFDTAAAAGAGERVARLREVLALVEELAGRSPSAHGSLDEDARLSAAYDHALPIDRRRFDGRSAETAAFAAAGVEALLVLRSRGRPARAAAARLADELGAALKELSRILCR